MESIGIVGAGIAGLHLALFLQQHGIAATLYSDRTPAAIRGGRLPNSVARFEHTRARERALDVDHWSDTESDIGCVHFRIQGTPICFRGHMARPASFVDMRIYLAALLEDFAARGGRVVVGAVQADDLTRLAQEHPLVVVAAGRANLTERFPAIPEHSPYEAPQRRLCSGLFRGIADSNPVGFSFNISPGHGEIFQSPFHSFEGRVSSLLFEAIPGGELEPITRRRYDDDPGGFEDTVLALLRAHAPQIYERVDRDRFGLTGPLDLLQGAITPAVRRGYAALGGGRYAIALGDVHIVNDPVLGQGANAASHAAWVLGTEIVAAGGDGPFDAAFCHRVEERIWEYAGPVTRWTNAALQPPPPHVIEVFAAATARQEIADTVIANFNTPAHNWAIFGSPEGAATFLRRHGWRAPVAVAS
jgi:2-polyprenyl-6-methoxyphenol hydroxylase-like FAD-dependent oxidoreductase